jgi:hypothetical protein
VEPSAFSYLCRVNRQLLLKYLLVAGAEEPLGDESLDYVRDANMMISRVMLKLLISVWLGCSWMLEQPSSSLKPVCMLHNFYLSLIM